MGGGTAGKPTSYKKSLCQLGQKDKRYKNIFNAQVDITVFDMTCLWSARHTPTHVIRQLIDCAHLCCSCANLLVVIFFARKEKVWQKSRQPKLRTKVVSAAEGTRLRGTTHPVRYFFYNAFGESLAVRYVVLPAGIVFLAQRACKKNLLLFKGSKPSAKNTCLRKTTKP